MMLDDDEAIRAAVGRTNAYLKRWWIVSAVVAVVIVGVALIAYLRNPHGTINDSRLESQIHQWAVHKEKADQARLPHRREPRTDDATRDPSVKVECPSDVKIHAGTTFHCILRGGGQSVRLAVTIENDKGDVTWAIG